MQSAVGKQHMLCDSYWRRSDREIKSNRTSKNIRWRPHADRLMKYGYSEELQKQVMFHRIRVAFCYQSIADSMVRWFDFWRTDFLDNTEENKERGTDRPDGSRCAKRQIQIVQNSAADWLSILSRSTGASFWNGRGTFYIAWTNRTQVKQQNHFENTLHSRTHSRVWKKGAWRRFYLYDFITCSNQLRKGWTTGEKKLNA